jgi:hypothetical protein
MQPGYKFCKSLKGASVPADLKAKYHIDNKKCPFFMTGISIQIKLLK